MRTLRHIVLLGVLSAIAPAQFPSPAYGQSRSAEWTAQVRRYAAVQNWKAALKLVNRQIAREPKDMEMRAWRARLLFWSGQLPQAEQEYRQILRVSRNDPDIWMGLSNVFLREGKIQQAQQAIDTAESLDPRRADIRAARGKVLQAAGRHNPARLEFRQALKIDPANAAARAGLAALRGEPKQEFRFGQENDFLSYDGSIHNEYVALTSRWTPHWTTLVSGRFYQSYGVQAQKFLVSVTSREPVWGALTAGGAIGHDNAVIPRSEVFWSIDRGWKTSDTRPVRGVEFAFGQHWFWYESARILTLNGTMIFYLPRDWMLSIGATGARSAFSASDSEWKPSETAKLDIPFARWGDKQLSGNLLFAAGTEDFAQVDQIGRFASQTYGSGLRFKMSSRQEITEYVTYQKRTQDRSDIGFGLSYDIRF